MLKYLKLSKVFNKFKNLDAFGAKVTLNTLGNSSTKSFFGALLSLTCLALVFASSILFGSDFLYKTNPRTRTEEVQVDGYESTNISNDNFIYMFKLESYSGNYFDMNNEVEKELNNKNFLNYIDFKFLYKYVYYDSTLDKTDWKESELKIVKCNEINNLKNNIANYDLENYMCASFDTLNTKEITFGYSEKEKVDASFEIIIKNKLIDKKTRTYYNMNTLTSYLYTENLKFSYVIPYYAFSPKNIENPLKAVLKPNSVNLETFNFKKETVYYKNFFLEDDLGWIFRDIKEYKKIGVAKKSNDIIVNDYFLNPDMEHSLYSLSIVFEDNHYVYYRSFMKIQELFALVGGFMKLIVGFCRLIVAPYNIFLAKTNLINLFYTDNEIEDNNLELLIAKKKALFNNRSRNNLFKDLSSKNIICVNTNIHTNLNNQANSSNANKNFPQQSNINILNNKDKSEIKFKINETEDTLKKINLKSNNYLTKVNNYYNDTDKVNNINNTYYNNKKLFKEKVNMILNNVDKDNVSNNMNLKDIKKLNSFNKNKRYYFEISYFKLLFYKIFNCYYKRNKAMSYNYSNYRLANTMLMNKLDNASLIKLNRQYDILKKLLLNDNENTSLNYLKKLNIENKEEYEVLNHFLLKDNIDYEYLGKQDGMIINDFNYDEDTSPNKLINDEKAQSIISYFVNKKTNNNLSTNDKQLINNLIFGIKLEIMSDKDKIY